MNQEAADRSPALSSAELAAFQSIITALNPLANETRRRLLESAATLLSIAQSPRSNGMAIEASPVPPTISRSVAPFSTDTAMSPKEFLFDKQPKTDVERIACLAYYLTHYRATPHFKTTDLIMLNTDAAQPRFSNPTSASNHSIAYGYLVPSTKGHRQLSAAGERFVRALPDREAMASLRKRSKSKKVRIAANGKATD